MRITPILIGAGLLLAMKAGAKVYGASVLNYYVQKITLGWEGLNPILYITLGIQNPSSSTFTVRSFTGTLFTNEMNVGNVSTFNMTTIKPNAQTSFVVAARLSISGVVSELVNFINGQSPIAQTLKLQGTINIDGVPVPVTLNYKVL